MRSLIALVLTLALALPALAADVPEARLKDLIRRIAADQTDEISSEVEPGSFEARPLVEQVVICTGTSSLRTLVALGDTSPLKKAVPAGTWSKLVKAQPMLDRIAVAMQSAVHDTAAKNLAARDIAASRLLVGTANLYLRTSDEAETAADKAIALFVAATAAEAVSAPDLQASLFNLATDAQATQEVRERAGYLYPLIADTAARAKVAVTQFHAHLGGGR